eukprot:1355965-Amorphochlora_amoeboformis.AAC.2
MQNTEGYLTLTPNTLINPYPHKILLLPPFRTFSPNVEAIPPSYLDFFGGGIRNSKWVTTKGSFIDFKGGGVKQSLTNEQSNDSFLSPFVTLCDIGLLHV